MSDIDGKKPLGLGGARPGQVKQSFSHGRTKAVIVETKKKKIVVAKPGAPMGATAGSAGQMGGDPSRRPAGISDAEMERRMKALQAHKANAAEEAVRRAAAEKAREEDRERRKAEAEQKEREDRAHQDALKAKADEEERRVREAARAEAESREARKQDVLSTRPISARKPAPAAKPTAAADPAAAEAAASRAATKGVAAVGPRKTDRERDDRGGANDRDARGKARDEGRRTGKLSLSEAIDGEGGRQRSLAAMKRKQEKARQKALGFGQKAEKQFRDVQLPETIVVSELANRMAERGADVVKSLMKMGMMVTMNQAIDADTAELVIEEFGHKAVRVTDADVEQAIDTIKDRDEDLAPRPPIVTIMGHVDQERQVWLYRDYVIDA